MLKQAPAMRWFFGAYLCISLIQIYAAYHNELFGDEAFYWLESLWLSWSYSEVPGWTPWTLAWANWLLPDHPIYLRLPGLLAAFSLPWLAMLLAHRLDANNQDLWRTGLLMLALPLLGIAGIMAIPDIWIIFFTLLAMWLLILAIQTNRAKHFVLLGLVLALGINVHIRFWVIVLITCVVFFWHFRHQTQIVFRLITWTLPGVLLGLVPVAIFNFQHDFPLLAFQLQDRHPWTFQTAHFRFFLVQILVTTPLVFWLCLKTLKTKNIKTESVNLTACVIQVAVLHWLLYALAGFFSDNLRLNVHWTLISYVLLLTAASVQFNPSTKLSNWAWISGATINAAVLLTLLYWMHYQVPASPNNARITNNAVGWQALAEKTDRVLQARKQTQLLADHFMTLAQLRYYAKHIENMQVLPHPLNDKHGRSKQLDLMGLLTQANTIQSSRLLVVEQTALPMTEHINYYQHLCDSLDGISLIDVLDYQRGLKTYHYFKTHTGECDMPPLVYIELNAGQLQGWVLEQKENPVQVIAHQIDQELISHVNLITERTALGNNELFTALSPSEYQLIHFKSNKDTAMGYQQIEINWQGHVTHSPVFYD